MENLGTRFLEMVGGDAHWLGYYAGQMRRHVDLITDMPSFRTHSEAHLDDAEAKLKEALKAVQDARKTMRPSKIRSVA